MMTFDKNTVFECYLRLLRKGVYSTLSYYQREVKSVPDKGVYMHIKPGYQKLVNLLREIELDANVDCDNLKEVVVGEGPINEGEYWGTFIDYFLKDEHYDKLFQDLINNTAFGASPEINFNDLKSRTKGCIC